MRQRHSEKGSFLHVIRRQPKRLLALTSLALLLSLVFASAATPAPATHFDVSAPASTTAGVAFDITVTALDATEAVDTGYAGTVTFTSSDGQADLPANYTFVPADNGVHTFSVTLKTAGNQTVTATDTVSATITGSSDPVSVAAGPLDHFTVTNPGTQTAGSSFNVTVGAEDAYGNPASGWTSINECVIFSGPFNSPPPGEVPPSYPAGGSCTHPDASQLSFDASGDATASVTLYRATTAQTVPSTTTLTVTDTGPPPNETGSSGTFTVNSGSLFRFGWTDQPNSSQTAGVTFDRVEATAYDEWDNIKTDYNPAGAVFSGLGTSPLGNAPVYGFSWANGIAVSTTMTDYKAEATSLAVTDGSVNASSSSFTVAPGPLDHFTIGNIVDQVAGTAFNVTATAFDQFGNVKTDYAGGATLSGDLNNAPDGTVPTYGAFGAWTSGVATASVTAFKAESGRTVTATDSGKTGTSNTFTVAPGPLDHFTIDNVINQVAGTAFNVAATAFDEWDNVKTNYTGGATLSGNLSNSTRGCGTGGTSQCSPVYGSFGAWTAGVASASVTAFKAEASRTVTATDTGKTGTSNTFSVGPNVPTTPPTRFSTQPTLTQVNSVISPAVEVTVEDFWGNPRQGDSVSIALGANPGGGTLLGVPATPPTTNASGIVTFANLSITAVGIGKTLVATVTPPTPTPGTTVTSVAFDIANQVTQCTGTCTATGSTPNSTTTMVDAFGLTSGPSALNSRLGPAVSAATSARLGVTVAASVPIPTSVCTGPGTQLGLGDGFWITTFQSSSDEASFKVVATLNKNEVREKPGNPGATKFDICLGAKNTKPGTLLPGCASATNSQSWRTKDGTCAVFDAATGLYWGLVADYTSKEKVKSCPTTPGSNLFPGVISKMKTGAGDVVITFCKPYPWDGGGGWR
jgi:hypothetical protein